MLVYHGTSFKRWQAIKEKGLIPRGGNGYSNWDHSIESNPDTVYLTDAYAMNFALASLNTDALEHDHAVIIEVETDKLNQSLLVADEDALEQVSRGQDGLPAKWSLNRRTRHYRRMVEAFAALDFGFYWSMGTLGTGGYKGAISPKAFTRVAIIDVKKEAPIVWEYMNSQVSVQNYRFLGDKYRALTSFIFGDLFTLPAIGIVTLTGLPPRSPDGIQVLNLQKETA